MARHSPTHRLDTVRFKLTLPGPDNDALTTLEVLGESETKRSHLWAWQETWTAQEQREGLDFSDTLRWWALIAHQDRPRDQSTWNRQISGHAPWEQLELFS